MMLALILFTNSLPQWHPVPRLSVGNSLNHGSVESPTNVWQGIIACLCVTICCSRRERAHASGYNTLLPDQSTLAYRERALCHSHTLRTLQTGVLPCQHYSKPRWPRFSRSLLISLCRRSS